MVKNIIIVSFIVLLSGCTTIRRDLESARSTIGQLEQSNAERAARNIELEELYIAERAGNKELEKILDGYIESERERIDREKQIVDNLTGIFSKGSDIIEQLRLGYIEIRNYFRAQGMVE